MIVISFLAIIFNISVVSLIIDISNIRIISFCSISTISIDVFSAFALKVISQCWILLESNCLEFSIRIEAKYQRKEVVCETDDRDGVYEFLFTSVGTGVDFVLYRRNEIDHEGNREEDTDEDV